MFPSVFSYVICEVQRIVLRAHRQNSSHQWRRERWMPKNNDIEGRKDGAYFSGFSHASLGNEWTGVYDGPSWHSLSTHLSNSKEKLQYMWSVELNGAINHRMTKSSIEYLSTDHRKKVLPCAKRRRNEERGSKIGLKYIPSITDDSTPQTLKQSHNEEKLTRSIHLSSLTPHTSHNKTKCRGSLAVTSLEEECVHLSCRRDGT